MSTSQINLKPTASSIVTCWQTKVYRRKPCMQMHHPCSPIINYSNFKGAAFRRKWNLRLQRLWSKNCLTWENFFNVAAFPSSVLLVVLPVHEYRMLPFSFSLAPRIFAKMLTMLDKVLHQCNFLSVYLLHCPVFRTLFVLVVYVWRVITFCLPVCHPWVPYSLSLGHCNWNVWQILEGHVQWSRLPEFKKQESCFVF